MCLFFLNCLINLDFATLAEKHVLGVFIYIMFIYIYILYVYIHIYIYIVYMYMFLYVCIYMYARTFIYRHFKS